MQSVWLVFTHIAFTVVLIICKVCIHTTSSGGYLQILQNVLYYFYAKLKLSVSAIFLQFCCCCDLHVFAYFFGSKNVGRMKVLTNIMSAYYLKDVWMEMHPQGQLRLGPVCLVSTICIQV